jgi:predicted hydrocarbon binding protein
MTGTSETEITHSNFRRMILATRKTVGQDDLNALLYSAGLSRFIENLPEDKPALTIDSTDLAQFNSAVENRYGRGSPAVLKRIGQEMFSITMAERPIVFNFTKLAMKMTPKRRRIRFIFESLINTANYSHPSSEAQVEETEQHIAYLEHDCPISVGRKSDQPICHLKAGELGAAVRWAAGKAFDVRETQCIARGDYACRFEVVEKTSLKKSI